MKYTVSANISTAAESIIIQKFRGHFAPEPDLEATVHVHDFRMTLDEVFNYIGQEELPERCCQIRRYAI